MKPQALLLKTFLFLILAEVLSIFAWIFPQFNLICFSIILFLTFILALKKLRYGIYIAWTELIIGSYGYLFSFDYHNTFISLRVGIFLVIIIAWLIHLLRFSSLKKYYYELKSFVFAKYYLLLAIILLWGFVWGILRGNNFGNIFLDFNNWLFYLYLLPLITVSKSKIFWSEFKWVLLAAISWLLIKTFLFLYIFSHNFLWALPELYIWIRDTRIGEITKFNNAFYRIFLQSQIFALLGFFIILPLIVKFKYTLSWLRQHKPFIGYVALLISSLAVVIISFSRSFWVGLIIGLFCYFLIQFYKLGTTTYISRIKQLFGQFIKLIIIFIIAGGLIFIIVNAPPGLRHANLTSLITQRTSQIEAAGSSRINMLKPLGQAIITHPLIGSGFGSLVTYRSVDPRILSTTAGASGLYTTYAFEWSYLSLLFKVGLLGLFIYLLLIYKILLNLWHQLDLKLILNNYYQLSHINLGIFLAFISLSVVNIFTPYLNHPLGIGFILIVSVFTANNNLKF